MTSYTLPKGMAFRSPIVMKTSMTYQIIINIFMKLMDGLQLLLKENSNIIYFYSLIIWSAMFVAFIILIKNEILINILNKFFSNGLTY